MAGKETSLLKNNAFSFCICRNESGVLSSFYSYFTMSEPANQKAPSAEEQEAIRLAHNCIKDCHLEQLVQESKFLREESLQELVKVCIMLKRQCDRQMPWVTQIESIRNKIFLFCAVCQDKGYDILSESL